MTVYTHNPRIEMEFHTREGQRFTGRGCYSYRSQRTLEDPTAKADIQFLGLRWSDVSDRGLVGKEISESLNLYDMAKVSLLDGRGRRCLDIKGLITDVRPIIVEAEGRPQHSTQISLSGLGEALVKYQVFWHSHIAGRSNLGGLGWQARSRGKAPMGRTDEVLTIIYDTFLNDAYVFTLADGRKLYQAISKNFQTIPGGLSSMGLVATGMEGSLWNTLKRYSDAPWNELFVDIQHERSSMPAEASLLATTYQDAVGLYLRPTPFSQGLWRTMAGEEAWGFEFEDSERMGSGEMLGRDEAGIYNFFWTPAKAVLSGFDQLGLAYNQSGGKIPIYDAASIRRYGLRRMEQGTEYMEAVTAQDEQYGAITARDRTRMQTSDQKQADTLIRKTRQLHQWFGYDAFYQGTISTRGRIGPHYQHGARIGGVLTRKRDGHQFYITGIQQEWTMPGPHITTMQVSRGHNPQKYVSWINESCGGVDT